MKAIKPILSTSRLLLRPLEMADAPEVFQLRSDDEVRKFITRKKYEGIEEAKAWMHKIQAGVAKGDFVFWAICLKENEKLIGTATFWNFSEDRKTTELGYELLPAFHRKGIMSEAVGAILNYGFESLQLETIEAFTNKNNLASYQLLFKNKFQILTERKDPGFLDNMVFALKSPLL